MNSQPRTQFELSEAERDQKPLDPLEEMAQRRRRSIQDRSLTFNSFCELKDSVPPPCPTDEQIAEYAPLLVASLRRLLTDCDWATRTLGSIDTSLVVRNSLVAANKVLAEAAAWKPEGTNDAVA